MLDHKQSQIESLTKDKRIVIKLPIHKKLQFIQRRDELQMSSSQFIIYLMNEYDGDHLSVIQNFRYNLIRRIKKGIDRNYLYELTKLRDHLNTIIDKT